MSTWNRFKSNYPLRLEVIKFIKSNQKHRIISQINGKIILFCVKAGNCYGCFVCDQLQLAIRSYLVLTEQIYVTIFSHCPYSSGNYWILWWLHIWSYQSHWIILQIMGIIILFCLSTGYFHWCVMLLLLFFAEGSNKPYSVLTKQMYVTFS